MITEHDLKGFNGTEQYFKDYLGLLLTDGTRFLRDNLKANWLISDIASVYNFEPKVKANREENTFLIVDLKINRAEKTAVLYFAEDKDEGKYINLLYKQEYKWTDITENYDGEELNFYLIDNVLLLPREY